MSSEEKDYEFVKCSCCGKFVWVERLQRAKCPDCGTIVTSGILSDDDD